MTEPNGIKIAWWSAGITSAVACKMALKLYSNIRIIYIETGKAHPDNARFKLDCEKWYGQEIETAQNKKGYLNPIDVVYKERYINGPEGAKCTKVLKKQVRFDIEASYTPSLLNSIILTNQIFGFEYHKKQVNRAIRFLQQYPEANALFPLIEKGLTKSNCAGVLLKAGIALPVMYGLGFENNNCPGCFKGGKGYWNKIRVLFPDVFAETAVAERHIGHSCIKGVFLDELDSDAGNEPNEILPSCGVFCELEFADIPDKSLEDIMEGRVSIYDCLKQI